MVYRKGELSPAAVDRGWRHQVALPADRITGAVYKIVRGFCEGLSLCCRGHSVRRDNIGYEVFCFAERDDAELFARMFDGTPFDPRDRGKGRSWFEWRRRKGTQPRVGG